MTPKEEFEAALIEQRHQYMDLDADSACCPAGFYCPACPPKRKRWGMRLPKGWAWATVSAMIAAGILFGLAWEADAATRGPAQQCGGKARILCLDAPIYKPGLHARPGWVKRHG